MAINIRPKTRKNFRPGALKETGLRFDSVSLGVLSVLLGLKVFWDIHCRFVAAKVKNLEGFSGSLRLGLLCVIFFLAFLTGSFSQISASEAPFSFKVRTLKPDAATVEYSIRSKLDYDRLVKKQLAYWQDRGYPFALLQIDTIMDSTQQAGVVSSLDPGPLILIDRLVNHGDSSISTGYLSKALGFRSNQPFSTSRFNRIPIRISQLTFLEEVAPSWIEWFGDKAILHVSLRQRKQNSFSGILGVLPQTEGKTLITGNIDLNLTNLFRHGIGVSLAWNRFAPSSQTADIKVSAPHLDYNGFGLEAGFTLFRQDSLLTRQRLHLQTISTLSDLWKCHFGVAFSSASSGIRISDTSFKRQTTNALSFSLQWNQPNGNGIVFQKKGFSISVFPALKTVERESGKLRLPQLEAQVQAMHFMPLFSPRLGLQLAASGAGIWSDYITLADQNRLGGFKTIRGFNENFFFTSQHILLSAQPQVLLDQNLLFGVFTDAMLYNAQRNVTGIADPAFAWSTGLALELQAGRNLVKVAVANGSASGLPFDLQATKIHFGYIATF